MSAGKNIELLRALLKRVEEDGTFTEETWRALDEAVDLYEDTHFEQMAPSGKEISVYEQMRRDYNATRGI